jgi:hypothetical protein
MAHRFQVSETFQVAGRAYVVAYPIEARDFTLSDRAELAGCPIEQWLDKPRSAPAGEGSGPSFAFCLRASQDLPKFKVGNVIELQE